jgi:hypothetical protein
LNGQVVVGLCARRKLRDICMRAIGYHHQLCDSPTLQEADFDGDHGKHGTMAVASPDERPSANALVTTRGTSHAQGSMRGDERYPRTRSRHLREVGLSSLSARSLTPRFKTVSSACGHSVDSLFVHHFVVASERRMTCLDDVSGVPIIAAHRKRGRFWKLYPNPPASLSPTTIP